MDIYQSKYTKFPKTNIDDPEAKEFIKNCKHRFEWSSTLDDECKKCKYVSYCKAKFWGKPTSLFFEYPEEDLKRRFIEEFLGRSEHEPIEDPETYIGE